MWAKYHMHMGTKPEPLALKFYVSKGYSMLPPASQYITDVHTCWLQKVTDEAINIRREAKMFPHLMILQKRGMGFFPTILPTTVFISKKIRCYTSVIVKQPFQEQSMLCAGEEAGRMINAGLYRVSAPKGYYSSRPRRGCLVMLYPSPS